MKVPYTIMAAADLKPGMRLYNPNLVAGWTVVDACPTQVYDDDQGASQPRVAMKFEDENIFTVYRPGHLFRVIGRHARPGHEHDWVQAMAENPLTHDFTVPAGLTCSQCGCRRLDSDATPS